VVSAFVTFCHALALLMDEAYLIDEWHLHQSLHNSSLHYFPPELLTQKYIPQKVKVEMSKLKHGMYHSELEVLVGISAERTAASGPWLTVCAAPIIFLSPNICWRSEFQSGILKWSSV